MARFEHEVYPVIGCGEVYSRQMEPQFETLAVSLAQGESLKNVGFE